MRVNNHATGGYYHYNHSQPTGWWQRENGEKQWVGVDKRPWTLWSSEYIQQDVNWAEKMPFCFFNFTLYCIIIIIIG